MFPLVALLFFASTPPDPALKEMAAKLRAMSADDEEKFVTADPAHLALVTQFRGKLRAWIEPQLPSPSATDSDCAKLAAELERQLRDAGILNGAKDLDDQPIRISRPSEFPEALLLRIDVSISWGKDGAAYLYLPYNRRWKQVLASERTESRFGLYLTGLGIAPAAQDGSHLVATLRTPVSNVGCTHGLDWTLYRIRPRQLDSAKLLGGNEFADVCEEISELQMDPDGFEVSYQAVQSSGFRHTAVLHYTVSGATAHRVPPVAVDPGGFVKEWLERPWKDVRNWTQADVADTLRARREAVPNFIEPEPATACKQAGRWQVSMNAEKATWYFTLAEPSPHNYQMLAITTAPQPDCTQ